MLGKPGQSHPTLTPTLATSSLSSPQSTLPATSSLSLARSLGHVSYETLLTISPLELLLQQLRNDHCETRVDAMRRCFVVANAIGTEATISQLLPVLASIVLQQSISPQYVMNAISSALQQQQQQQQQNQTQNQNQQEDTIATADLTMAMIFTHASLHGNIHLYPFHSFGNFSSSLTATGNTSTTTTTTSTSTSKNAGDNEESDDTPVLAAEFGDAHEEEDEVLLLLAEQLGLFVTSGLIPNFRALSIVPLLEKLASTEETVVRDKAVDSIHAIVSSVTQSLASDLTSTTTTMTTATTTTQNNHQHHNSNNNNIMDKQSFLKHSPSFLLAMIKRLFSSDWFTPKVSACAILPSLYSFYHQLTLLPASVLLQSQLSLPYLFNVKRELRHMFQELADDETPMVRRSAAKHLGPFVQAIAKLPLPTEFQQNKYLSTSSWNNGNSAATNIPAYSYAQSYLIYKGTKDEMNLKKHFTPLMTTTDSISTSFQNLSLSTGSTLIHNNHTTTHTNNNNNNTITTMENVKTILVEEIIPSYHLLAKDEQDSIRSLAIASSNSMACSLGMDPDLTYKYVLPMVKAGTVDPSWRVRQRLANDFASIVQSFGFHENGQSTRLSEAMACLATLLQDYEAEVRSSAVENIARIVQLAGTNYDLFHTHISPFLSSLATDSVMEVRSNLALTVMDCCNPNICNVLPDKIILNEFKGILETLLEEEYPEVQLQILSKLSSISHLLSKMDKVVHIITVMVKSANWRVREAIAKLLPHLADSLGLTYFENHLLQNAWLVLLLDPVSNVRTACVQGMPKLLSVAGATWIQRTLLQQYQRMYEESVSYLTRITILRCYASLVSSPTLATNTTTSSSSFLASNNKMNSSNNVRSPPLQISPNLLDDIISHLLQGLNDKVANVRMVATKCLSEVSIVCDASVVNAKIRPALNSRAREDNDEDCKFFAQMGLESCV